MFRIGQEVVCVDDSDADLPNGRSHRHLVKGHIYTVTRIGLIHPLDPDKLPCICVAEAPSPWGYWEHRFRSREEKKTDISIFKEMLLPKKKKAKA